MKDELMTIAQRLVSSSEGRLRIAFNEDDGTTAKVADAAHFLKLDERRIGRDIELYGFLGRTASNAIALTDFLEGVILPLQQIPAAFQVGLQELAHLRGVFGDKSDEWIELLLSLGMQEAATHE